jgi:hypothetical protein
VVCSVRASFAEEVQQLSNWYKIGLVSLFILPFARAENNCAALLKGGVFDERLAVESNDGFQSFRSFYCSRSTKASSGGGKLSLDVPIPDLPLGVSAENSSTNNELSEMCEGQASWSSFSHDTREYVKKASAVIVDGFNKCMNAPGLHGAVVYTGVPKTYDIAISFVPATGRESNVHISRATNRSCQVPPGTVIFAQPTYFPCTRTSDQAASQVIVYFQEGGSTGPLTAPSITPAVLPWEPLRVAGTVPMSGPNGTTVGTITITQVGREVAWTAEDPNFTYWLQGTFTSRNHIEGVESRQNKGNGCIVKRDYRIDVSADYEVSVIVTNAPRDEQPPGTANGDKFCDLPADFTQNGKWRIAPQ